MRINSIPFTRFRLFHSCKVLMSAIGYWYSTMLHLRMRGMEKLPASMVLDIPGKTLSLDPRDRRFVQNPYRTYAKLHETAPIFFWREYGIWCCTRYSDVNRLLRDKRFGRENLWGAPRRYVSGREHLAAFDAVERHSLLELEPPAHTRLRTLVNRAFVSRQIERLRPEIEKLANTMIDRFEMQREGDLLPMFATPIPVTVIACMLGIPSDAAPLLLDWSHRMVVMYTHGRTNEDEKSANSAAEEFSAYLRDLISARRRQASTDDLLSALITARDHGQRLSDDELVTTLILLLNAGH
jgi:cytochrome P450